MIRKYIEKIGENKKPEDMEKLGDMLADIIEAMKDSHPEMYEKYKMCLYTMAYGYVLTEDMAKEIVHNMKPYGEHWNIETTTAVKNNAGISDISDVDFYTVMNKTYNDNKDTVENFADTDERQLEMYISLTKDFVLDPDAKKGKVFKYFTM